LPAAANDRSETLDSVAPLPARASAPRSERKIESPNLRRAAAIVAIVVVALAAAVQLARARGSKETRAWIISMARRVSAVAADGVIAGVSAVTERVGMGRVVPAAAAAAAAAVPPEAPPVPSPPHNARRVAATAGEVEPPFAAFDLEPHRAEEPAPTADAAAAPADTAAKAPAAATTTAAPIETPADSTIYTAASEGVSPPVAIRPQLPTALPPTINAESLSRIELVVDGRGLVESVRLLGRVPSVKDKMFLSVAKAWQFQPALKSGKAVKYRKTVWLADQ
jgi:hypothetical protein